MRLALAMLTVLVASGCTASFFQPHRSLIATPERAGLRYESVTLRAADGVELAAWSLPAEGEAQATVLFLHGNAENISTHFFNVAWMPAEGFNVLALDYRGYGASAGSPSLAGAQQDIDAAVSTLLARPDVDPRRIVIFGQSLGGALALHYAARGAHRGALRAVVSDSAFADYRMIVPLRSIGGISPLPLVLIHGEKDPLVPAHHAQRLYEAAKAPKELWMVPGVGHLQSPQDPALRRRLSDYLRRAAK
ncbi:MAG TPA: alpha/beta fold hydrolase [Burkholderiales bacterium]|nr:alpha/beta fold hydrolase [Burkholderiales bacterium]